MQRPLSKEDLHFIHACFKADLPMEELSSIMQRPLSKEDLHRVFSRGDRLSFRQANEAIELLHRGTSWKAIESQLEIDFETILDTRDFSVSEEDFKAAMSHSEPTPVPKFIFTYKQLTPYMSAHRLKIWVEEFKIGPFPQPFLPSASWCQTPKGQVVISGGEVSLYSNIKEVFSVDPSTDFAIRQLSDMNSARGRHGSVWVEGYVYAIAGEVGDYSIPCERLHLATNTWENLPELEILCGHPHVIYLEGSQSLYAVDSNYCGTFNGNSHQYFTIQQCNINTLTWSLLYIESQSAEYNPAFKADHKKLYYVRQGSLWSFELQPFEGFKLTNVGNSVYVNEDNGPKFLIGGTLYHTSSGGYLLRTQMPSELLLITN